MLVNEKTLRAAIRNCMVKEEKRPLNEIVGLLNFLEKWLGPIVDKYLEAQAAAAEKAEQQATKIAKQEFSSAGVKPERGALSDKSNKGYEKTYNILMKILKRLAAEVDANLAKASQVSGWQPKDDSKESREEWLSSDDGKNSLSLFDAAGSLSAMIDLAIDFGMDLNDISSKFKNQDDPTPSESAEWIKSALSALSGKSGVLDPDLAEQIAVIDSIISNINSEAKDTAKENPEEFEEAKKEAEAEVENKDKEETSEELTDEQKKSLQFVSDSFEIVDNPEDLKLRYTNTVKNAVDNGFFDESEAKEKLEKALAGFEKYIETEGKEGLDQISNLGTEKLGNEKSLIRNKAKQSLDIIARKIAGQGSGKGGGSGSEDAQKVIDTIKTTIEQKKTPWTEEQIETINNTLKQSNAPIFLKGLSAGELIGFKYKRDALYGTVLQGSDNETDTQISKSNVNDIALSEIRKYIRGILIREHFSR